MKNRDHSTFPQDVYQTGGLTKREYFIGQALSGHAGSSLPAKIQAMDAIKVADAVIEILEKEGWNGQG